MRTGCSIIASDCSCAIGSCCAAPVASISWWRSIPLTKTVTSASCGTLLRSGDRTGVLRQFDVLAKVLDDELGIGPSRRGVRGARPRARAVDRPVHRGVRGPAAVVQPRSADLATQRVHFCTTTDGVRLAYASSGDGPPLVKASNWLTHLDYDWDSPVWRHWWQALSRPAHVGPLRRARLRSVGLGCRRRLVHARGVGARPRDRRRRARARAVPVARHLAGRTDRRHLRRPSSGTGQPRHRVRHLRPGDMGEGHRRATPRARGAGRAHQGVVGERPARVPPGVRRPVPSRRADRAVAGVRRAAASLDIAPQRPSAVAGVRVARLLRGRTAPRRADAHPARHRRSGVGVSPKPRSSTAMVPGSPLVRLPSSNHILQADEPAFATFIDEVERFVSS